MARRRSSTSRPNVVHRGQRATLNGKPVIADGKGNWLAVTKGTYGNAQYSGAKSGTYKKGENSKPTTKPTKTKPTKANNTAEVNARVQKRQQEKYRAVIRSGTDTKNTQLLRPAPGKGDPKPTPTKPTPTKPAPTKPAPTKPTKPAPTKPTKPATSTKATPAKTKPRTWLADNYKPGKGPARRSTPGTASNKPKQSSRMRDALSSLKVRDYKKKK